MTEYQDKKNKTHKINQIFKSTADKDEIAEELYKILTNRVGGESDGNCSLCTKVD